MNNLNIKSSKIMFVVVLSFSAVVFQYFYDSQIKDVLHELSNIARNGGSILFSDVLTLSVFIPLFFLWLFLSFFVFSLYVSFDEIYSYLKNYLKYEFTYIKPKGHRENTSKRRLSKRISLHLLVIVFSLAAFIAAFLVIDPLSKDIIVLAQQAFFSSEIEWFQVLLSYLAGGLVWVCYLLIILFLFELFKEDEIEEKMAEEHNLEILKKPKRTKKVKTAK